VAAGYPCSPVINHGVICHLRRALMHAKFHSDQNVDSSGQKQPKYLDFDQIWKFWATVPPPFTTQGHISHATVDRWQINSYAANFTGIGLSCRPWGKFPNLTIFILSSEHCLVASLRQKHEVESGAQLQTFRYKNGIKNISSFKRLIGEVVSTTLYLSKA